MNCRKYRAYLVVLIAVVLIAGAFLYIRNIKANEVPTDATLVKNCEDIGDDRDVWA